MKAQFGSSAPQKSVKALPGRKSFLGLFLAKVLRTGRIMIMIMKAVVTSRFCVSLGSESFGFVTAVVLITFVRGPKIKRF